MARLTKATTRKATAAQPAFSVQRPLPAYAGPPRSVAPSTAAYSPVLPSAFQAYAQQTASPALPSQAAVEVPGAPSAPKPYDPANPAGYVQGTMFLPDSPEAIARQQLGETLRDPYNIPKAALHEALAGSEAAGQAAENRYRAGALASGAGGGGVARLGLGNIQQARGSAAAEAFRDYEKYRTELGDRRLAELGLGQQQIGLRASEMAEERRRYEKEHKKKSGLSRLLKAAAVGAGTYFGPMGGAAAGSVFE